MKETLIVVDSIRVIARNKDKIKVYFKNIPGDNIEFIFKTEEAASEQKRVWRIEMDKGAKYIEIYIND